MPVTDEKPVSFSEISGMLDKAILDIAAKKDKFDQATKTVQFASNEYQDAVNKAKVLRSKLNDELNKSLGEESDRVKFSG